MTAAVEPLHHADSNLEDPALECPPFWWDLYPPGSPDPATPGHTQHEKYEVRPIPPYPFDDSKFGNIDVSPFLGTFMAWLPRCAPQIIRLDAAQYNPAKKDDPRRKLVYVGQYNVLNPRPMEFHKAIPEDGWWYATPQGIYVYHPYSAAWDLGILQIKGGNAEVLGHPGSFGRPVAVHRRIAATDLPKLTLTADPASLSMNVGESKSVSIFVHYEGEPDTTKYVVTGMVDFTSSDATAVSVDESGTITLLKDAGGTVTATLVDGVTVDVAVTKTAPPTR